MNATKEICNIADSSALLKSLQEFELTNILTMLGGNEEKLVHLLKKFSEKYAEDGLLIRELISADNFTQAQEYLHALRGTAGNLGISLLHRVSDELEDELKNRQYTPQTLENFDRVLKDTMTTIARLPDLPVHKKILNGHEFSTFQKIVENLNNLLANDRFVDDDLLAELKLYLYDHQHPAYADIVEKIQDTEYPQARQLLKNLLGYATTKTSEPDTAATTILIVDDNRITQEAFVSFLKRHYSVKVASSGSRALQIAKSSPYIGLILLDVIMPDMNGYEVCRQLKNEATTSEIPVIFVTVGTNFHSEERGLKLGAIDYLKKPIDPITTLLRIKNHLVIVAKNKAAHQELAFQNAEKERRAAELMVAHNQNDELNHQVNQMQKLESIGQLTSGIAHDFNNILACMLGYNEMNLILTEDIVDETLRVQIEKNIEQLDFAGQRAVVLIQKMMNYCREKSPPKKINVQPTLDVIDEVVTMLRPALTSRIKLELALNCTENIEIDAIDLHQILTNLAVNARDAMKNSSGIINLSLNTITLSSRCCTACAKRLEGDFIELSMSDNGTGIDPKIVHRIFTPFFTTKELGKGTGLGLSTVSSIVHHAEGHILIDSKQSQPNQGTTFRLLFPII